MDEDASLDFEENIWQLDIAWMAAVASCESG